MEDQREMGGDVNVDVPFNYLRFFLEDDAKLAEIREVIWVPFSFPGMDTRPWTTSSFVVTV